jgi:DNA-binding transcriptional regulator YiaG
MPNLAKSAKLGMALVLPSHTRYANLDPMNMTADAVALSKARALARSGAARSVRLAAGLSLSEMARPVEVSPTTIFRWENGERVPRGEPALRYLELLERLMGTRR